MTNENRSRVTGNLIFWLFPKIVIVVGAFGVFVFYTWFSAHQPNASADYAAWVQAIGSIGAVLGAFYIGERQAMKARNAALEEVARQNRLKIEGVLAICGACRYRVDKIHDIFCVVEHDSLRRYLEYHRSQIEILKSAFEKVAVHELGDSQAIDAFLGMSINLTSWLMQSTRLSLMPKSTTDNGFLKPRRQ